MTNVKFNFLYRLGTLYHNGQNELYFFPIKVPNFYEMIESILYFSPKIK